MNFVSYFPLGLLLLTICEFDRIKHACFANTVDVFTRIYDPSVGEKERWYINDHTFIKDPNGTWHLFGITHAEPLDPEHEIHFAHATAPHLLGPWTKRPFALDVDPKYFNETHLWAPHVIQVNDSFYMFYCGGGPDHTKYAINLAISKDLFNWTRLSSGPVIRDGFDARDPMVVRINNLWHLYYTATDPPKGGNHIVAYRTSNDLIQWSERKIAFTDPSKGEFGGPTESPFIQYYNGSWYLFNGPREGYRGTGVFKSQNPTNFSIEQKVGWIYSHAAEVINDDGQWWISHSGWDQGGVYLAPLNWNE